MEAVTIGAARNIFNNNNNNHHHHHGQISTVATVAVAAQKRPREIAIPQPNVQDLVVEIHQALTTKQRLSMLRHVHQVVSGGSTNSNSNGSNNGNNNNNNNNNYSDPSLFLWLLEAGTLDALLLQLNFILHRRHGGTIAQEVVDLCRVLALFLRNCPPSQQQQGDDNNTNNNNDCQKLALQILSCFGRRHDGHSEPHPRGGGAAGGAAASSTATSSSSDFMLLLSHAYQQWPAARLHILAILHAVSGREKGTELVLQSRVILLRIVDALRNCQEQQHENSSNSSNNNSTTSHTLLQALGLIKNISYFKKDSWSILVEIPGFLKALSSLTQHHHHHQPHHAHAHQQQQQECHINNNNNKSRERLSAIWRNFAVAQGPNRRTCLLTRHADVVSSICCLAMNNNNHNDNHDNDDNNNDVAVYRNFLTILVSLSMDMESSLLLMLHGDGILPNHVLQRLLQYTADRVVRKRAARTIRLWASHESTGALLVHCPDLLNVISTVAHQDESKEVRHEAAEAFGRCASFIAAPMPQQHAVLDALACLCQVSSSVSVIARALKGQAAHVNNRLLLANRPIFVNALTSIALESTSPSVARTDACCALADLAAEEGNRRKLLVLESDRGGDDDGNEHGGGETNVQLLEALRVNTLTTIPSRRDYAAQALVYLAENNAANRSIMAQHAQLLQALIQYAATSDSNNIIKHHVKRVILQIVQEL